MKVLILGATGAVGLAFIDACLADQHHVVIYARSPQKLSKEVQDNPLVSIVKGELTDEQALKVAMTGVHAIISALGPAVSKGPMHPSATPLATAYHLVLRLMKDVGVKRLIALGTASNKTQEDKFSLEFWTLVNGVATFAHNAYKDIVAIGEAVRTDPEALWTLARVPILTNKNSQTYHAGYIGDGQTAAFLPRHAYATFVVTELGKNEYIKKSPMISG